MPRGSVNSHRSTWRSIWRRACPGVGRCRMGACWVVGFGRSLSLSRTIWPQWFGRVWMPRGRDGQSVAQPAARTLAAHDVASQLDTGSDVTPATKAAQSTPKIASAEEVLTAGPVVVPQGSPHQAAQATQAERPRVSAPRSKTPPSLKKPASTAKPAGRHDDVLSER